MKCCNIITDLITGVIPGVVDDGPVPPESLYCIQWSVNDANLFFPCVEGSDVNGNTNTGGGEGSLCQSFSITDFDGVAGNIFYYDYFVGESWYAQVIRPVENSALEDLGYYAYDVFGNPTGPIPIPATNSSCTKTCYTATFDVVDISTDGFSQVTAQSPSRNVDMDGDGGLDPVVPFDDPDVEALYLAKLILRVGMEPDATVSVTINSPTNVTLTICTLLTLYGGTIGNDIGGDYLNFNFTQV